MILDKIHGQLTVDNLPNLFYQIKRNTQCVSCSLGECQFGYLGLFYTPETYDEIPNSEEFVRPTNPGPFCLIIDTTNLTTKRTKLQIVST